MREVGRGRGGRPHTTPELAEFLRIRRRLGWALLALLLVTPVGVVGFSSIGRRDHHSLVDAIYMTVITLTTVGYGEIIPTVHNPTLRLFNMFIVAVGGLIPRSLVSLGTRLPG